MDDQRILDELIALLEANDVKVRREPLGGGGGGLCAIKGENMFFLDTESPSTEAAYMCAEALLQVADIETLYIRPEVREFIESHRPQSK
jgi:hypothetical protein